MFKEAIQQLKKVNGKTLEVYAKGHYPVKAKTKVQDVAHYQNDGTDKIGPARFVETAEKRGDGWTGLISRAFQNILKGRSVRLELGAIGKIIAKDIMFAVNRIDTGRLKKSMRWRIK